MLGRDTQWRPNGVLSTLACVKIRLVILCPQAGYHKP